MFMDLDRDAYERKVMREFSPRSRPLKTHTLRTRHAADTRVEIAMSYPEGHQMLFQKLDEDLQKEAGKAEQADVNPSKMSLLRKRHISQSKEESSKESKMPHAPKNKKTSTSGPKSKRVSNNETETSGNPGSDSTAGSCFLSEEQNQPFPVGAIVWGQFSGEQWFPAMVITGALAGQSPAKDGWTWVMWFGDHKINEIRWKRIDSFLHQYRSRVPKKLALSREEAIVEALKECAARAHVPGIDDYAKAKSWGITSFGFQEFISKDNNAEELISLKPGMRLPHLMELELKKLREQKRTSNKKSNESKVPETDSKNSLASSKRKLDCDRKLHVKDIVVKDFCLGCGKGNQKVDKKHPLFQGYICSKCEDCLRESLLALDSDGCSMFCVICGEPGSLCVCEEDNCGRSYCDRCLNIYLTPELYEMVHQKSPWLCYLCTNYRPGTHGLLRPRDDWQDELVKFFNPPSLQKKICLDVFQGPKRKLRVLSLFDGIAVAYLALQRLGLDIEAYFACEICENAKQVITFNHGKVITQLGDIQSLDIDMLESILPIDLVIGSPPKEDLDVTNMKHEGFNGSGMYMMQFWLLLKNVELVSYGNRDTPIFWLVENTASMKSEYRQSISKMYGVESYMWDAQFFGPYIHPGLFWGNIPNLDSAVQCYIENKEQLKPLNSYVTTQLKRQAQVSKLRNCAIDAPPKKTSNATLGSGQFSSKTEPASRNVSLIDGDLEENSVSTHSRSAVNSKNKDSFDNIFLYPILAEGVSTNIWVQEVEKALNLPAHYTDCCRLTIRDRQKLLRQASSVDVLTHVLAPLAKVYALK